MTGTTYIGIDPGITGALAAIEPSGSAVVFDLPTRPAGTGVVKRELDPNELARMLRYTAPNDGARVVLERTSSMPGQGVASMFSMGVTRGVILGVLDAAGYTYVEVHPATWKRHFWLLGADKGASLRLARLRCPPNLSPRLVRAKDHNRAEALLLALYLKETSE